MYKQEQLQKCTQLGYTGKSECPTQYTMIRALVLILNSGYSMPNLSEVQEQYLDIFWFQLKSPFPSHHKRLPHFTVIPCLNAPSSSVDCMSHKGKDCVCLTQRSSPEPRLVPMTKHTQNKFLNHPPALRYADFFLFLLSQSVLCIWIPLSFCKSWQNACHKLSMAQVHFSTLGFYLYIQTVTQIQSLLFPLPQRPEHMVQSKRKQSLLSCYFVKGN